MGGPRPQAASRCRGEDRQEGSEHDLLGWELLGDQQELEGTLRPLPTVVPREETEGRRGGCQKSEPGMRVLVRVFGAGIERVGCAVEFDRGRTWHKLRKDQLGMFTQWERVRDGVPQRRAYQGARVMLSRDVILHGYREVSRTCWTVRNLENVSLQPDEVDNCTWTHLYEMIWMGFGG